MESTLLDMEGTAVAEKTLAPVAAGDSTVTDRRDSSTAIQEFESDLVLAPVPAGRRKVWREIRVKVVPAVVFLLTIAAIIYLWPPS